jgi:hypothetical protein
MACGESDRGTPSRDQLARDRRAPGVRVPRRPTTTAPRRIGGFGSGRRPSARRDAPCGSGLARPSAAARPSSARPGRTRPALPPAHVDAALSISGRRYIGRPVRCGPWDQHDQAPGTIHDAAPPLLPSSSRPAAAGSAHSYRRASAVGILVARRAGRAVTAATMSTVPMGTRASHHQGAITRPSLLPPVAR